MKTDQPVGSGLSLIVKFILPASYTKHTTQTRERILEAAESVFADNGYHEALVDEIGQRTSISKGGLYFHFPSKEDLFFAVMDRLADKLVTRAEKAALEAESPLRAAEAAIDEVLSTLSGQKRLARLLIIQGYTMGNAFESKRAEVFDRFACVIGKHLRAAKEAGQIREENTDLASLVWLGAMNEVVVHWLFADGSSPKDVMSDLKSLLLASVRSVDSKVLR